jgi:Raf kinase inhibitor-like YbhB/YbcL family protein
VNRLALLLAALMPAAALAACSHDGRTLRPPRPDQTLSIITTTTAPSTTTSGASINPGDNTDQGMTVTAPWQDNTRIDVRYTCKGANVSPAISWTGVPSQATELALAMTDLDADGFVHWLVAGIDPASTGIAEGKVPANAVQAINGFNKAAWGGPCPPSGQHRYLLTLYALGAPSGITTSTDGKTAVNTLEAHQLASMSITGVFGS